MKLRAYLATSAQPRLLTSAGTRPPPPPPVLEMDGIFNLELVPGQYVSLDVNVNSDDMDMARMEDGTTVDGVFWGKLDIVHTDDVHKMEFSGTRLANQELTPDLLVDTRVLTKLAHVAAKPATAKCSLSLLSPNQTYCDVMLTLSPYWRLGTSWPKAEEVSEGKVKYFLRANPGGALEHFESQVVTTALYYEAMSVLPASFSSFFLSDLALQTRFKHDGTVRLHCTTEWLCNVLRRFCAAHNKCAESAWDVDVCSNEFHKVSALWF